MKRLTPELIHFFQNQGFVIVSTIGKNGLPHNSCKGIARVEVNGRIYLIDLYKAVTYRNLKRNPKISITAVDEHKFRGYCLKGTANIVCAKNLDEEVKKIWEEKIAARAANRLVRNIREEKGHPDHPEARLPKPEYMFVANIEEVVDLTPGDLR
ncbi:MAG: hypothetical protein DRP74_00790 [Candidatus Omnitrophota bacterium]|nr:MAG: hypothetical protein DRP74_00790 [Candidatus Omnitrophota bacterium]